ncbi:hypothetical protein [Pseudonocardia sp. C8]|nr:hypothetical protein [Pseudonocardia sp. C8]
MSELNLHVPLRSEHNGGHVVGPPIATGTSTRPSRDEESSCD